jgi:hypothetical protein
MRVRFAPIALQKSPNAARLIFRNQGKNKRGSPIDITLGPMPKSPVSSSQDDLVPHMIIRSLRLQPGKIAVGWTKRLLRHYPPEADVRSCC